MNRLGLLRRQMRMTQKELAQLVGCDQSYISYLERTAPSIPRIDGRIRQNLEAVFGRKIKDLMLPLVA